MADEERSLLPLALIGLAAVGITGAVLLFRNGDKDGEKGAPPKMKVTIPDDAEFHGKDCGGSLANPRVFVVAFDVPLTDGSITHFVSTQQKLAEWMAARDKESFGAEGKPAVFWQYAGGGACWLDQRGIEIPNAAKFLPNEASFGMVILASLPSEGGAATGWFQVPGDQIMANAVELLEGVQQRAGDATTTALAKKTSTEPYSTMFGL